MAPAVATYAPRDPTQTVLYHVIAEHLDAQPANPHLGRLSMSGDTLHPMFKEPD
jgi:hypothetical protein